VTDPKQSRKWRLATLILFQSQQNGPEKGVIPQLGDQRRLSANGWEKIQGLKGTLVLPALARSGQVIFAIAHWSVGPRSTEVHALVSF
jgi:hypothetical protein